MKRSPVLQVRGLIEAFGRHGGGALFVVLAMFLSAGSAGAAASVPTCTGSQLRVVYVNTTGAAGTGVNEYGFENVSSRRCTLSGYPRVQLLATPKGKKLATFEGHAAAGALGIAARQRVVLAKHSLAYFAIVYHFQTGYGTLTCPTSAALRLTAPGVGTSSIVTGAGGEIAAYAGSQVHLQCGLLHVSAVSAKRFQ